MSADLDKYRGIKMDRKLKQLEEEQKRLMKEIESGKSKKSFSSSSSSGNLLEFIIGLGLLAVGLFWIFQSVRVTSYYGTFYHFGGMNLPNGTIIIPFLIGIVMLFLMEKKVFGWIVVGLGVAIILISIITSVRLYFNGGNLFNYILMFGFTLVGGALVLKNLLKK